MSAIFRRKDVAVGIGMNAQNIEIRLCAERVHFVQIFCVCSCQSASYDLHIWYFRLYSSVSCCQEGHIFFNREGAGANCPVVWLIPDFEVCEHVGMFWCA